MDRCPNCGVDLIDAGEECYSCGAPLGARRPSEGVDREAVDDGSTPSDATRAGADNVGLLRQLLVGSYRAIPIGNRYGPEVEASGGGCRVEDGRIAYAMHFPFARGYLPFVYAAGLQLLAMLAVIPVWIGIEGISGESLAGGTIPVLWLPASGAADLLFVYREATPAGFAVSAIGALLFFAGLLPAAGYAVRLVRAAARGATRPPISFDPIGVTADGLRLYVLYAPVVGAAELGGVLVARTGAPDALVTAIGTALTLGAYVLVPALVIGYAVSGRLTVALSPRRIADFVRSGRYLVAVAFSLLLGVAIYAVLLAIALLLSLTIVGLPIGVPLAFTSHVYVLFFLGSYWGATYFEATGDGRFPEVPVPDRGAVA